MVSMVDGVVTGDVKLALVIVEEIEVVSVEVIVDRAEDPLEVFIVVVVLDFLIWIHYVHGIHF